MPPEKIGRYIIEGQLGQGGMGTVYLALDPLIKRQVAVKVLPPQFNHDHTFRERFRREAEIIASLEHPSIVPLHDFGEHENQPYLVMRYMPGGTLNRRLLRGPLSLNTIIDIMERVAPGLDKAHVHGIIHRDLKPSNILFDADDEAYLADFGIAKVQEATAALTGSAIIGTPAYMSPEQAQGDAAIDGRSDVYAMGIILFQMLTGRAPYTADTPMKLVVMHIMEPVPKILAAKPDLPESLEPLMARALAKDPSDRFYTVGDLTQTLRHIVTETRNQSGLTGPLGPRPPAAGQSLDELFETEAEPVMAPTPPPPAPAAPSQAPAQTDPDPESQVPIPDRVSAVFPPPQVARPSQAAPATPGGRRRFAPWIWLAGLGGVGALAVALVLVSLGVYWFFIRDPAGPPTAPPTATLPSSAMDPTAPPATSPPTQPPATGALLYGPMNGSLFHEIDGFIAADAAGLSVQNFIAETTFRNPYGPSGGPWDAGFLFRQTGTDDEFRVVIESTGRWSLTEWFGGAETILVEGTLDNLALQEGSGNQLRLVAYDNLGLLYVNGALITHLDLASRVYSGDIQIATDLIFDFETSGEVTSYQDFIVRPLAPIKGPWNGELSHNGDDFLSEMVAGVDLQNFIVESTVFNPYPVTAGNWDAGYLFRHTGPNDQFRLFMDSTGYWSLTDWSGGETALLSDGLIPLLDTSSGGANELQLIAVDGVGLFFVNGVFIGPLDLSSRLFSGDLSLATGLDYELMGETTSYLDFAVIPLP